MNRKNKNIVVLSDGTGQAGGKGHDSNVYKLFRMLEDRTDDQVVFYDEGLGTGPRKKLREMAFGAGFDTNLLQCYRFIFDHYKAGDKIFLFGFSRGAATVRSLASFIHYFGILPASRPELIEQAYRIYMNRLSSSDKKNDAKTEGGLLNRAVRRWNRAWRDDLDDEENGKSAEFVRLHPNQWVQIEFMGVWDTVPALGLVVSDALDALLDLVPALKHTYHNFQLRKSVKHACHALSVDDNRKWFWPTVWKDTQERSERKKKIEEAIQQKQPREYIESLTKETDKQKVEQVWFGGSHTDVGGGFWEAGFSDIALEWMVQKAFEHGLKLYFGSRKYWNFCVAPDAMDDFHDPRSGVGKIYAFGERNQVWDELAETSFGPLCIHETVLQRAAHSRRKQEDPLYRPWILDRYLPDGDGWLRKEYDRWCVSENHASEYERCLFEKYLSAGMGSAGSVNDFNSWKSNHTYTYDDWLKDHIAEFGGRKYLVERIRKVVFDPDGNALILRNIDAKVLPVIEPAQKVLVLRDYDVDTLLTLYEDIPTLQSLQKRARKLAARQRWWNRLRKEKAVEEEKYRIERDRKRWEGYLKELKADRAQSESAANSPAASSGS